MMSALFGARAQVVVGVVMVLTAIVSWPVAAFTFAKNEPQFVIALSELALIFAGYGVVATGLGYRATERVEEVIADEVDVEHADTVLERGSKG